METSDPQPSAISFPSVYTGNSKEPNQSDFNAAVVSLDARLDSDLKWNDAIAQAKSLQDQGLHILWELNFGLFHELPLPLSDTSQYRSLNIAIDHFFDTVLSPFKDQTIGVIVFKGSLDFSHQWPWDPDQIVNFRDWLLDHFTDAHSFTNTTGLPCKNLLTVDPKSLQILENGKNLIRFYCARAALDYISMICSRFETDLLPYTLLDCEPIKSKIHCFQLLDQEDFDFIQPALKGLPFDSSHALGWQDKAFVNGYIGKNHKYYRKPDLEPTIGVVIPNRMEFDHKKLFEWEEIIEKLEQKKPVKWLSEKGLTVDWQGLDHLVVFEVSDESKRKLEGFIAAGGRIVCTKALHLSNEVPLIEFFKSLEEK